MFSKHIIKQFFVGAIRINELPNYHLESTSSGEKDQIWIQLLEFPWKIFPQTFPRCSWREALQQYAVQLEESDLDQARLMHEHTKTSTRY